MDMAMARRITLMDIAAAPAAAAFPVPKDAARQDHEIDLCIARCAEPISGTDHPSDIAKVRGGRGQTAREKGEDNRDCP